MIEYKDKGWADVFANSVSLLGRILTRSGLVATLLGVVASLLLTACGDKPGATAAARPPAAVRFITVAQRDVAISSEFVAHTRSAHEVEIRSRVNGFIERQSYTEGEIVPEGQVMVSIDPKPFQAQLNAQRAALDRYQSSLAVARANLDRIKPLAALDALSQRDLDDATGRYEAAAADVEQATAMVETAQLNLSYCTIRAPFPGVSGKAERQEGAYVNEPNSLLTHLAALSPMEIEFSVSENQIQTLRRQTERGLVRPPRDQSYQIEVILVDGSVHPEVGHITFRSPDFDPTTGTYMMRAQVTNRGGHLRPNQFVRVRLVGAARPKAILVPQRAVQQGAKGAFVWVIGADDKAQPRPVTTADWSGEDWIIEEGLAAGDRVLVEGLVTLAPGAAINALPLEAAAAGAGNGTQH